jgi:hypothetical protein
MQVIAFQNTSVPAEKSAAEIEALLQRHGAAKMGKEYANGRITSMYFEMATPEGSFPFRMPVKVDAVYTIFTRNRVLSQSQQARYEQAERTAWRIAREWVKGQLDMIQTQMVTLTEVFFPYMLIENGQTAFEVFRDGGLSALMPPAGESDA